MTVTLKNIKKSFGDLEVIKDISFSVEEGKATATGLYLIISTVK